MSQRVDIARDDLLMSVGRGLALLLGELADDADEAQSDFELLASDLNHKADVLHEALVNGGYR